MALVVGAARLGLRQLHNDHERRLQCPWRREVGKVSLMGSQLHRRRNRSLNQSAGTPVSGDEVDRGSRIGARTRFYETCPNHPGTSDKGYTFGQFHFDEN
jgi:hypothetical protein